MHFEVHHRLQQSAGLPNVIEIRGAAYNRIIGWSNTLYSFRQHLRLYKVRYFRAL